MLTNFVKMNAVARKGAAEFFHLSLPDIQVLNCCFSIVAGVISSISMEIQKFCCGKFLIQIDISLRGSRI